MPDTLVFAALVPKLMGAKVILYLFECMPELLIDTYRLSERHRMVRLMKAIERRASRFAHHVVYCGPGYRAIQEPRAGKKMETSVVLNVPDEAVFRPEFATPPRISDTKGHFRIVTHGSLLEKYGVQTLVEAAPLLKGRIAGLEIQIAGDGEHLPALRALSTKLGVDDTVKFVGVLPTREIPQFISQADVGVVAILHGYMLPTKLFEYFSMHRPVVACSIPFIKDFCVGGEVLFFPPGDHQKLAEQLLFLYEHPKEREALVRLADSLYAKSRWPVMREQYLNVYRRLGLMARSKETSVHGTVGAGR
jgi:glycosyltransferase involved in cell wall biosynthesis